MLELLLSLIGGISAVMLSSAGNNFPPPLDKNEEYELFLKEWEKAHQEVSTQ